MTFDCDNRQAMAARLDDLPPYSWLVWTRRGGHVTWTLLAAPVGKHKAARGAPEAYLTGVSEFYHLRLARIRLSAVCHAIQRILRLIPFGVGASLTRSTSCRQ